MKFRSLMACLLLVAASIKGYGQDTTGLSLPELWEQAFANYPGLDVHRSQQRQADIDKKLARNQYLPDVLLQAQNTFGTQNAASGAFFSLPGIYNVNGSGLDNSSDHAANLFSSVVMDWKFFQFGQQQKSQEAAQILTNQAGHRLELEKLNIQARLSRIYFVLFFHQHMEQWARNNNERLQAIFEASRSTVKAGLSPGADSLLIKATLNQISADLHVWQGRKEESKIALARWLNTSANQLSIKTMAFLEADPSHRLPEREQADNFHPQLAFEKEQLAYVKKQKELVSVRALPALSLLGGIQLRGNSIKKDESFYETWEHSYNSLAHNYAVGLGLTWNLGNAFAVTPGLFTAHHCYT